MYTSVLLDQLKSDPADHFWIGLNDRDTGVYHWLDENVKVSNAIVQENMKVSNTIV